MPETAAKPDLDEKFCFSCGAIIKKAAEICVKCGVRQQPPASVIKKTEVSYEPATFGLKALTFCFPIAGIILYFVWLETKPRAAKDMLIWTIISVVSAVVLVLAIIGIVIGLGLSLSGNS